jgi:spore germination protein KC
MHRKVFFILFSLIIVVNITSCQYRRDIDDRTYVVGLGLDKGITDKLRITIQILKLPNKDKSVYTNSGISGDMEGRYSTITVDASSLYEGLVMLDATSPSKLDFGQTKYLIVSEELAKSDFIDKYLESITSLTQIRKSIDTIITRCSAKEFISASSYDGKDDATRTIESLIAQASSLGFFPRESLFDFYNDMESTYNQPFMPLASVNDGNNLKTNVDEGDEEEEPKSEAGYYGGEMPRKGGMSIELFGAALFDGNKMVGELNGEETRLAMMIRGDYKSGIFSIQDPGSENLKIVLKIDKEKNPNINIKFKHGIPYIKVKINMLGEIKSVQSGINYESLSLKPVLEEAFKEYIRNKLEKVIDKCKTLKTDEFKFGTVAVEQFSTIQEWEKYNWFAQFENAEVNTEVEFHIKQI